MHTITTQTVILALDASFLEGHPQIKHIVEKINANDKLIDETRAKIRDLEEEVQIFVNDWHILESNLIDEYNSLDMADLEYLRRKMEALGLL